MEPVFQIPLVERLSPLLAGRDVAQRHASQTGQLRADLRGDGGVQRAADGDGGAVQHSTNMLLRGGYRFRRGPPFQSFGFQLFNFKLF